MNDYIWDYRNSYEWMKRVRASSLPPLIVCCAISGGVHGKEVNQNLPETPEEQENQAYEAYKLGASMIHIHVRDPNAWYQCSGDTEQYRLVNGMIREKCPDVIINNTTGGGPGMTQEERICVLDANPEVATLNMGPIVSKMIIKERKSPIPHPRTATHRQGCKPIDFAEITLFAKGMKERGIKPEMEIYHPGQYWMYEHLVQEKLIEPIYLFQFVMGDQAATYPTPQNLLWLLNELPVNSIYAVAGLGQFQLPMTAMAILLGGHLRVGMEDNVYSSRGRLLNSNAEIVERIVRIARDMNREIATPAQAREMMGLCATPSRYR
jgi:3-keto-5-aminohexanoate cleavage enzyme